MSGHGRGEEDWVVVNRRRKHVRHLVSPAPSLHERISDSDPSTATKLFTKIESCISKLQISDFFDSFVRQLYHKRVICKLAAICQTPRKQMSMVIYGIGDIGSHEQPQIQLALAILLKRKFDWIGEIEVFDPVITTNTSLILQALGCKVLTVNECGRRKATIPTLFFMPHCDAFLYNNLLETNWKPELLNQLVILGNSFEQYANVASLCPSNGIVNAKMTPYILHSRKYMEEIGIETVSDDYFHSFHQTSWHFFSVDVAEDWSQGTSFPAQNEI